MHTRIRGALTAIGLALLALTAQAAERPAETDSLGRVVRSANGVRQNYGPRADGRNAKVMTRTAPAGKAGVSPQMASKASTAPHMNAAALATTYSELWRFNNWGYGIGQGGFWPVDIDANGDNELVYGLGGGGWAIADYSAATSDYRVLWKSQPMAVAALRVVEVANTKNVWVAGNTDGIRVYNALTQTLVATLPLPQNVSVYALEFGDGNNDGTPDVMALALDQLLFFNAATLQPEATVNVGAQSFAVGNVDNDAAREIVLGDGRVISVNGANVTVEWNKGSSFGYQMRLADIDGDGRDELVASQGWSSLQAWDLETQALKWEHATSHDIAAVRTFDVTGDGRPEVFYGDGQWGAIHALDGVTHTELWNAPNPEHGVTDVAVCDSDGDGVLELIWGAGATSSGPDYMYVVNVANRAQEFRSYDISNYFTALDVGDVDNDGRAELVVASYESESGYADGVLLIFDAVTHALEYRGPTNMFEAAAWTGVHTLRIANVDSDPQPEILVGTDRLYDGRLYVVDGLTRVVEHAWPFDSGSPLTQLYVADVDGDGLNDVLAGNGSAHSGSPGQFLYAINPRTGATIWKSQGLGWYVRSIYFGDVGAPGADLVSAMGPILRVRWSDKQQVSSVGNTYSSVVALDVTGSAALELVAGRYDGSIDVLDGDTLAVLSTHAGACTGNAVGAMVAHGPRSVALVCNTSLQIYDLTTSSVVTGVDTGLIYAGINGSLARFVAQGKSSFFIGGEWPAVFADLSGNSVPTVPPLSASLHWRSNLDLTITGTDPDADPLTYQISSLPVLGTVNWINLSAGTLRYTAAGTAMGSDSIRVRAYDGFQFSDPQTIALTLTNTAPAATTTTLNVHWRGAQTVRLGGTDVNNDPVTFALGTAPTRGTLTLVSATTGDVNFVPAGAYIGGDTFGYTVSDGADTTATRTVQLTLTNTAPTAPNPSYSVVIGNTVSGRVAGTDANSDPLTYAVLTAPARGTLTLDTASGVFDYVPTTGSGSVTAQVAVRDGVSESAPVTITFNYPAPSSSSGGGGGGGGSLDLLILAALGLALVARMRRKSL